ncbi:NLR family CARD domain-containing protein 3 [Brachyhypopomus gauderio]|uniref:NLR family CARD domain-containing protein 3 n=1 Tax=Brachyhypopomus gauderio TaxID=698409 RepID=UPI004040FCF1
MSGNEDDSEVERIMERPPSSYGSMRSDDHEEEEEEDEFADEPAAKVILQIPTEPARIRLHRSDSPETGITSVTQGHQSSIHKEGAFLSQDRLQQEQMDVQMDEDQEFEMWREKWKKEQQRMMAERPVAEPEQPRPPPPEGVGLQSGIEHPSLSLPYVFKAMQECLGQLNPQELHWFKRGLCSQYKKHFEFPQLEDSDVLDVVDRMLERRGRGEAVHMAVRVLQDIRKNVVAEALEHACRRVLVQHEVTLTNKRRYHNLYEGTCRPGQQRYVTDVYVEPPIFIGGDQGINTEHDVHRPNFVCSQGTPVRASDIFRPLGGEEQVRLIVMTGVPAIGLTVAVQKFIMDWTNKQTNQDFQCLFSLPGRELHLVKDGEQTFLEMLNSFYPETKHADFLDNEDCLSLFIIDALELCKQRLDFKDNPSITNVKTPATMDALLTSLIKGTLLPHARIWITCHRAISCKVPHECVSRFMDLKGFDDAQKDEYFTKRTKDPALGLRVLTHVKRSPALYNVCHLPLLCWIVSFIFERRLREGNHDEHAPTLTAFYTQYMIVQTNRKIERYVGTGLEASRWKDRDKDFLQKMGKLALRMVQDERDVFYEEDVSALQLDLEDVSNRGGISTEVRRKAGYPHKRAFSFVHYSVQEYMAAVYTYVTYRVKGKSVFEQHIKSKVAKLLKDRPVVDLYRQAVDRALASPNGHLDLYLRFLFGFVTEGTESHLRGYLMPQYHPEPKGMDEVLRYVNKKIKENVSPERCRNLELCLLELEEGKKNR